MVHVGKSLFLNYFQLIPQVGLRFLLNPHGKSGRYYRLHAQAENRDAEAFADSPQVVSCKAEKATGRDVTVGRSLCEPCTQVIPFKPQNSEVETGVLPL